MEPLLAGAPPRALAAVSRVRRGFEELAHLVLARQDAFDAFMLRSTNLSDRLYREVVASRMRPFGDGLDGFPRLVRDLARQRGPFRYIAKIEDQPRRNQMLVGFLVNATEAPEQLDPRLAGQQVIDLEYFSPICNKMN